jgi:hypothetical protein
MEAGKLSYSNKNSEDCLAAIKAAEHDDSQSSHSGASCMRFASTTISKAFLFIFIQTARRLSVNVVIVNTRKYL